MQPIATLRLIFSLLPRCARRQRRN